MGEPRRVVERFWAILEAGDVEHLPEVWTQDSEFRMPGVAFRGIEPMKALRDEWWTMFPDLHHETRVCLEADNVLLDEIVMTGTHEGTFRSPVVEIPATHARVEMTSADVITVRHGKIATWHAYPDMMGLVAQLQV